MDRFVIGQDRPSAISSAKAVLQKPAHAALRHVHWSLFSRALPDKIAVYFHALPASQHAAFSEAIHWIKSQGYAFARPDAFLAGSGKLAYVSFDDCFQEWHQARPLFDQLGLRCTFFTNTSVLRDTCSDESWRRYVRIVDYPYGGAPLSRAEIRDLHDDGHLIAAHTHSHHALQTVSDDAIASDLALNKSILEEIAGTAVTDFAFPFGMRRFYPPAARAVVSRLGFKTVSFGIPAMLFAQPQPAMLHRTQWNLHADLATNVRNLAVDGRLFERLTGRSPIG